MSTTGPALVLIIRHGEKVGDSTSDQDKHPHLSIRGSSRAAAIPSLFDSATPAWECTWTAGNQEVTGSYGSATPPVSPRFCLPNFIFATAPSKNSNRPVETVTPLSVALNLPINAKHADKDYHHVAHDILNNSKYQNQVVLICWHHGTIPHLVDALNAVPPTPKWDGTVFDRVWCIPFIQGKAGEVKNLPQQLLYGDSR